MHVLLRCLSLLLLSASASAKSRLVDDQSPSSLERDSAIASYALTNQSDEHPVDNQSINPSHTLFLDPTSPPVIYSISGCQTASSPNYTANCTLSNRLTIFGANFENIDGLFIGDREQDMAQVEVLGNPSSRIILHEINGWFYESGRTLAVEVRRQAVMSVPFYGISFTSLLPSITGVTGCAGVYAPYNYSARDCGPNSILTVTGSNFWGMMDIVVGPGYSSLLPFIVCDLLSLSDDGTNIVVQFPAIMPSPLPKQLLELRVLFGVNIAGKSPIEAYPVPSNRVIGVTLVTQNNVLSSSTGRSSSSSTGRSSSSSSTGRRRPSTAAARTSSSSSSRAPVISSTGSSVTPPQIYRVSGCVDSIGTFGTADCPTLQQAVAVIQLTLYGSHFAIENIQRSYSLSIGGVRQDTLGYEVYDEYTMLIDVQMLSPYTSLPRQQWLPLVLSYENSQLNGSTTINNVVMLLKDYSVPQPEVTRVSGCDDLGVSTVNCEPGQYVTIYGSGFPIYAQSILIVNQMQTGCQANMRVPGTLLCPLPRLIDNPCGPSCLYKIYLSFPGFKPFMLLTSMDHAVSYVYLPSTSTGGPSPQRSTGTAVTSDDSLDGMKYALMVIMLIALIVLGVATCIYLFTCWKAQQRAFVSSNGSAAIDMREVLLN